MLTAVDGYPVYWLTDRILDTLPSHQGGKEEQKGKRIGKKTDDAPM